MAKPLQTLAVLGSLRLLLFVFNLLFWATGLVLLLIGLWISVKLHKYLELDREISSAIPLLISGLGLFILILSTLACQCSVKGNAPKLYIYSTLLFVIFLTELCLLLFGYYFRYNVDSAFHEGLATGLELYGKDSDRTSAIDDIQSTLLCCGVNNYTDWQVTPWGVGHGGNKLPHSCCQWTIQGVCSTNQAEAHLHTMGCYRVVLSFVMRNLRLIGLGILGVSLIHIFGITLGCILARQISKSEYEEISTDREPMLKAQNPTSERVQANQFKPVPSLPIMPLPVATDSQILKQSIQNTRQKLRSTSRSKKAKRAQSIDWTTQQDSFGTASPLMDHQTHVQVNHSATAEDYYSVPKKCHRTVSSNYLDHSTDYPWSEATQFSSSIPQPPSSPPPSPPYANKAMWAHQSTGGHPDELMRADSMDDIVKFY